MVMISVSQGGFQHLIEGLPSVSTYNSQKEYVCIFKIKSTLTKRSTFN